LHNYAYIEMAKRKEQERIISIPIENGGANEDGTLNLKKVSENILDNYLEGKFRVLKDEKKKK